MWWTIGGGAAAGASLLRRRCLCCAGPAEPARPGAVAVDDAYPAGPARCWRGGGTGASQRGRGGCTRQVRRALTSLPNPFPPRPSASCRGGWLSEGVQAEADGPGAHAGLARAADAGGRVG
jgi:hypothetical protein